MEQPSEPQYRIAWKVIRSGETGKNMMTFPKEQAERICEMLNLDDSGWLTHWIEPVPEEDHGTN